MGLFPWEGLDRQIKLLHPLIPPPDLSRALDTGVQGQIFAQAILNSAVGLTSARGKGAFREVQERLEEMRSVKGRVVQYVFSRTFFYPSF